MVTGNVTLYREQKPDEEKLTVHLLLTRCGCTDSV